MDFSIRDPAGRYLPLPLPGLELFVKAGAAHLWAPYSFAGDYPGTYIDCTATCAPLGQVSISRNDSETDFAYGAGAQFRFGAFALRAQYERISYGAGDPNLLSLGLTWML